MKFARRVRTDVEVNVTALIDVVFLLLIFFMVSTTFTKETRLSIELPEASGEPGRATDQQIEITISRAGDYSINNVALVSSNLETLKSALDKVSNGNSGLPLIITADSATQHQSVVTAMDAAGQLGFTQMSITTRNATAQDED